MIEEGSGFVVLHVWIQPKASKDEVVGIQGDALKVRIAAPPVDGEANEALERFLAKRLGLTRADVKIVRGHTGRRKSIRIAGVTASRLKQVLGL